MTEFQLPTYACPDCNYPYEPGLQTEPPCPACGSEAIPKESESRVTITALEDTEIEELTKTEYVYNEKTFEKQPVETPLTDQELADLKEQRDRNLDELGKVAVKEVTVAQESQP